VLNFSDYADAFFTLKAKNLSGKFLIVDDKGVIYRPSSWRKAWSGEELASGVMLYTAAARTKVFFIVPESSKLYPKPRAKLTVGAISKLYRMRQKELSDLIKAKTNADAGSEKIVRPKYRFD
jgi:hypothetical protein